jgi:hypothetical protein
MFFAFLFLDAERVVVVVVAVVQAPLSTRGIHCYTITASDARCLAGCWSAFSRPLLPSFQAVRNFAIASSRVAACPFVTLGIAGTIAVIDQNQRSSGGELAGHFHTCG